MGFSFQGLQRALFISLSLFVTPVWAEADNLTVKLEAIEKIQSQELGGDELYFTITEFPLGKSPSYYQIPGYPTHWLSDHLEKIKDIVLWKKSVRACENIDVVFSLVEKDLPPWNLDDDLGTVELKVRCENGQVKANWSIPNPKTAATILEGGSAFSFTGKNAEYHAVFKFEDKPSSLQNNQSNPNPNVDSIREAPIPTYGF